MKKFGRFLFASAICLGMCGCKSSTDKKIELKRDASLESPIELNKTTFETKITDKDSFVVVVEASGCMSCISFMKVLNSYMSETHAIIYTLPSTEAEKCYDYISFKITPTLFIFSEGKQIAKTDYDSGELNTDSTFKKYLSKYAYLSPVIRISEEQLQTKINNKETFIIKYSWDKCGDCSTSDKYFSEFFKKNSSVITIYEVELSEYYDKRENKDDPIWTNMTEKYGLSKKGSAEYGWQNGVVPTYQYRKEGNIAGQAIIYNEVYETGENQVEVTESYYSDSPALNKTYKATNDKTAYQVYQESTAEFFLSKLKVLLNNIFKI